MSLPPMRFCPSCSGPLMRNDVPFHDWLRIAHQGNCPIYAAEDSLKALDWEYGTAGRSLYRNTWPHEAQLLTAFGYRDKNGEPPTTDTPTHVGYSSPGVRWRAWPTLEAPAS